MDTLSDRQSRAALAALMEAVVRVQHHCPTLSPLVQAQLAAATYTVMKAAGESGNADYMRARLLEVG